MITWPRRICIQWWVWTARILWWSTTEALANPSCLIWQPTANNNSNNCRRNDESLEVRLVPQAQARFELWGSKKQPARRLNLIWDDCTDATSANDGSVS
mmetsp:Transcript_7294/g.17189  ORF Transcript_7294/g.17189 Transcript_7294/m.17189 type:complete len:99 (-) Transcript_7294:169-465(-)